MAEAPPLGLVPKEIHLEKVRNERVDAIVQTLYRYAKAGLAIQAAWIVELEELLSEGARQMTKGERLEITVSVLATDELDDDVALQIGRMAVIAATRLMADGVPTKRFISSVAIGAGPERGRKARRAPHGPRGAGRVTPGSGGILTQQ